MRYRYCLGGRRGRKVGDGIFVCYLVHMAREEWGRTKNSQGDVVSMEQVNNDRGRSMIRTYISSVGGDEASPRLVDARD